MPKPARKKWPFKFSVRDSLVRGLMPPIHEPCVIGYQLNTCILFVDDSAKALGLPYFVSKSPDGKNINWLIIDPGTKIEQIQHVTNSLVIICRP